MNIVLIALLLNFIKVISVIGIVVLIGLCMEECGCFPENRE